VDPESDLAIATMAQLLLQEGRPQEALEYFEKSVDLGRTEQELVSAISYAEVVPPPKKRRGSRYFDPNFPRALLADSILFL